MATTPILPTGRLEKAAGCIPELWLPPADLFSRRSSRLSALAAGHTLGPYLTFLAFVTAEQQQELDRHPEIPLPEAPLLSQCREHAMPPLASAGWAIHPHWHVVAGRLAQAALPHLPSQGQTALQPLLDGTAQWLDAQAQRLLAGRFDLVEQATAPLIGAALQVQWTYLACQLKPHDVGRESPQPLCPVCGSHPVASVIRTDTASRGLRYLHCALCGSEWHVVRAQCSQCGNDKNIDYYSLDESPDTVRAEYCSSCQSYLKLLSYQQSPPGDPVADDLATMSLDMLMEEKGAAKNGFNYFLLPARLPSHQ